jgi:hypothetical protein
MALLIDMSSAPKALAAGPFTVAHGTSSALTASTGNLYWTAEARSEFGASSVRVLRASKDNIPGGERELYLRSASSAANLPRLGRIVYANAGTWYGYFIATIGGTSEIIRVPLAGGTAATIATSSAGIISDIVTDGTYLYWSDRNGLRRMAVTGGEVTTLVNASGISRIGVSQTDVYFVIVSSINSVPKGGGAATTHANATSAVTDLYVHVTTSTPTSTTIYWAEENAAVKSHVIGTPIDATHQGPVIGRRASSVGFDGSRVLWIDCTKPGNSFCSVRTRQGSSTSTVVVVAGVGARNLVWDTTQVFWISSGIRKYVH